MEKIEISVMEYYARPWYYPFMPPPLFKALEEAFLNDQQTACVSKADYEQMMSEYRSQLAN
jgi:hypothetical protein